MSPIPIEPAEGAIVTTLQIKYDLRVYLHNTKGPGKSYDRYLREVLNRVEELEALVAEFEDAAPNLGQPV